MAASLAEARAGVASSAVRYTSGQFSAVRAASAQTGAASSAVRAASSAGR